MPQLHCYLPDGLAKKVQEKAAEAHLPVSRYIAMLIEREVGHDWPDGYFEVFGAWQGAPLERPAQGTFEEREVLS